MFHGKGRKDKSNRSGVPLRKDPAYLQGKREATRQIEEREYRMNKSSQVAQLTARIADLEDLTRVTTDDDRELPGVRCACVFDADNGSTLQECLPHQQQRERIAELEREINESLQLTESCSTLKQMAEACIRGAVAESKLADLEAENVRTRRWVEKVSKVANDAFNLDGCCHWETVCEAIKNTQAQLAEREEPIAALLGAVSQLWVIESDDSFSASLRCRAASARRDVENVADAFRKLTPPETPAAEEPIAERVWLDEIHLDAIAKSMRPILYEELQAGATYLCRRFDGSRWGAEEFTPNSSYEWHSGNDFACWVPYFKLTPPEPREQAGGE